MQTWLHFIYRLSTSLILGGMVMLALVVTPALFTQLGIDKAAEATSVIFPRYFVYVLLLFGICLGILLLLPKGKGWKMLILVCMFGVVANLGQITWLLPQAEALRSQIGEFATTPKDNPTRKAFGKLHGISNGLNLLVLLAALGLVYRLPKEEI